jgi:hypothetical protein
MSIVPEDLMERVVEIAEKFKTVQECVDEIRKAVEEKGYILADTPLTDWARQINGSRDRTWFMDRISVGDGATSHTQEPVSGVNGIKSVATVGDKVLVTVTPR